MDLNVGHGNIWSFLLAYGWGILLFLAFVGAVLVGLYWITITLIEKIGKESGAKRAKTIAWTAGIALAVGITSLGLWIPLHPTS